MFPFDKFELTKALASPEHVLAAASANKSCLVFVVYYPLCTTGAKEALVPPIRCGEIIEHMCNQLQEFILFFIVKKNSEESAAAWCTQLILLKTKGDLLLSVRLSARQYRIPMAHQLHLFRMIARGCWEVAA
jgi:hypothetical protein